MLGPKSLFHFSRLSGITRGASGWPRFLILGRTGQRKRQGLQGAVMSFNRPSDAAGKNGQARRCTSSKEGLCGCGVFFPNCTSWSIKRYYIFLQTLLLISLAPCGSSSASIAATPATDSLVAPQEAATPALCKFYSSFPVTPTDGKSSQCPV